MITIFTNKIKSFSQKTYDTYIYNLPFYKLSCTCGTKGQLIKHAYYVRFLKSLGDLIPLIVLRVRCKSCHRTHAILPDWIVPYSRLLLDDHISIIQAYTHRLSYESIMLANLLIDENNILYIVSQYLKHWKERIASFALPMDNYLTKNCFRHYQRQFMQIKYTPNIFFVKPT